MSRSILHITVHELCEHEGISEQQVVTIVEHGIARPLRGRSARDWEFDTATAGWMQKALRLRRDLELDWIATAMLIDLLQQRDQLRTENQRLRQQLQRFLMAD